MAELHVRWLVFATGERFRVSLWPPDVGYVDPRSERRSLRDALRPRLLVFESDDWRGTVPVYKQRLGDFTGQELRDLYLIARRDRSPPSNPPAGA